MCCLNVLIGGSIYVGPLLLKIRFEFAIFIDLKIIWWWKIAKMEVKHTNNDIF
jgi:hypothetical protein